MNDSVVDINRMARYGPKSSCCIVFCSLGFILCFLFSVLMNSQLAAFTIPAAEGHWDLRAKAQGCRRAAFAYLGFAALSVLSPWLCGPTSARCCNRLWYRLSRRFVSKERAVLLTRHGRKASDLSDYTDSEME